MKQRDKMRSLYEKYDGKRDVIIRKYASAEKRGEVSRESNLKDRTSEQYASRLFSDGIKKGWISK